MRYAVLLLVVLLSGGIRLLSQSCCQNPDCKAKAESLAIKITGLTDYLPRCSVTAAINEQHLRELKSSHPDVYKSFIQTAAAVAAFINGSHQDTCFMNALPEEKYDNVFDWISYINTTANPPKFPSSECCTGWKRRFEIGQGASEFLHRSMQYVGSVRAFLVWTPGKPGVCGNHVRILAGPAVFLRNNIPYAALSSRVAIRLKDIAPSVFSLGSLNLFGGYETNFNRFDYALVGIEAELGPIGANLSVNQDMHTSHQGFQLAVIFGNKILKKKK